MLGWDIGFILQYQQRQLDRQAEDAGRQRRQALQEERQRIAREVHDVLAHSLSVTMLHLTAARRSLEEDADVEEAVDALRDAETAGRTAMAEIRNTVGLLGQAADGARPSPDARDIAGLVEQFRGTGLDVTLEQRGDPAVVSAAAGLGLFRIVQESLANVAKHQPRARVGVVVELHADRQAVQVWNTLPGPVRAASPDGAGLVGMRQRAELLDGSFDAGPRGGLWVVEARLPRDRGRSCVLGLPKLGRVSTEPA
jgi:signal transduction histidine kinase